MPHKVRTTVAALLAVGALALTACGDSTSADESGLATVNEGSLTVCSNVPFKPFEYVVDGEYTGFDIELTREIAKGMGLEHEIQNVGFDGLQSGTVLAARQCDLIAAAMSITEERADKLAFSDPYYDSPQTLLVPADSPVASLADLKGKKIGVQQGTTGETYARENAGDAEIMSFQTDAELFQAIQAGNIDAVLQDHAVNLDHTEDGKFRISATFETGESYGFAMKKDGSEDLVAKVNEQLAALRENGKYQELHDRFFTK
ncbi:basic amino acid ABC transporter substrate-binding protein [Arthrobacter sp. zg-Y877]|uniref:basic amino acid ABC transporter substrate-binding protein n=1 Tax=Arthrobacter sp. zg-Y877 TaxID=3049074 RepID=UPI0025A3BE3C|nr:basic amino acid ABC transporter substrate-binding protein [Arthrobacter sp. zg-Y877]MDM7990120.1 basic amino acid ABC transporter substrate-binding protein [Arthrobacter sp. zg-Y877]